MYRGANSVCLIVLLINSRTGFRFYEVLRHQIMAKFVNDNGDNNHTNSDNNKKLTTNARVMMLAMAMAML